ncbi:MAG: MBL fold metallo-hydrolase, partial [Flammeovirgaceae bacterium]
VLITHNHQDHILFETLLPLRHKIKNIIVPKTYGGTLQDPNLKLMFQQIGFSNVFELGEMESIRIGECEITGLPFLGEHCDIDIRSKICHHVKIGDFRMLFAADSCNIQTEVYRNVQALMGVINILFLGMECDGAPLTWLYGPLLTEPISREKDNSRRLAGSNFERGMELVNVFQPNEIYVYAMGQEPWLEFISSIKYTPESNPIIQSNKLIAACRDRGLTAERLFGEKELLFEKHQVAM